MRVMTLRIIEVVVHLVANYACVLAMLSISTIMLARNIYYAQSCGI